MHQHGSSNQPQPNDNELSPRFSVPIKIVLLVSIGIVVYFLVIEHRAHLEGFLPYSFLLIFVLMHLLMHGGHGGHGGNNGDNRRISSREDEADRGNEGHGRNNPPR